MYRTEGALIARRLLAWMEYLHKSGKNEYALPTRNDTYLLVWTRTPIVRDDNAGQLAEGFIRHMWQQHSATVQQIPFVTIKAWYTAKHVEKSAEHRHRILDEIPSTLQGFDYHASSLLGPRVVAGACCIASRRILREIEDDAELEPIQSS
jgi:hypothetical protein